MKFLKWTLGTLAGLIAIFAIVGMLLPRQVTIERSIRIDAGVEQVFPHVAGLKAMAAWSPWLDRDPDVQLTYSGPDTGEGATLDWASEHPNVGNGHQVITGFEENVLVTTALDFGEMGTANADLVLEEADGVTTVTWTLDADMGAGPFGRWMGLMMDRAVGPDYELGLSRLKSLVEG
ncbi:SRPBCC family protein [Thalassococcus sp. CAU 1522]|uniref:SRPBCC family protein n=1 Tax=Thalassococcus arenae TaxID=2851652 RepID=A0ABS6N9P1_9RHOB|nr:SRPBCC family protein [Thalassococcus arenae]MBV2360324.1 SRPBCC family protein [Thalassococcus arenae]